MPERVPGHGNQKRAAVLEPAMLMTVRTFGFSPSVTLMKWPNIIGLSLSSRLVRVTMELSTSSSKVAGCAKDFGVCLHGWKWSPLGLGHVQQSKSTQQSELKKGKRAWQLATERGVRRDHACFRERHRTPLDGATSREPRESTRATSRLVVFCWSFVVAVAAALLAKAVRPGRLQRFYLILLFVKTCFERRKLQANLRPWCF